MPPLKLAHRERLNPPDAIDQNQLVDNTSDNTLPRTIQAPLAPLGEQRVMLADRAKVSFTPDPSYANVDVQKGGAPGRGVGITSQSPSGITTPGGVPSSAMKLSFGEADWSSHVPTALPAHLKINANANPNAAQRNQGIWAQEGPMANTKYSSPAPWAAGTFIG